MKSKSDVEGLTLAGFYDLAYRAHCGTSFSPEVRAVDLVRSHTQELTADMELVTSLGGDAMDYKERYENKLRAWLHAKSNCISTMITGGSNFPVRRAEKANRSERNRSVEFSQFRESYIARLRKAIRREERANIDPVQEVKDEIKKLTGFQETMKAANKIIKSTKKTDAQKVDELGQLGIAEKYAIELMQKDFCGRIGFPSYKLTNNLATIKNKQQRLFELERRASAETKEVEREDGIRIVENTDADRIQLFFPGKPSPEMIATLKSRAFKWSPSNGCWQRQLTDNAKRVVAEILG